MQRRVKHYDLGDLSVNRRAGSQASERVQKELKKSFTFALNKHIPDGAIVGEHAPLNSAWLFRVGFRDKQTDTDTYRKTIKENFPSATVTSVDRGDEWTLPYVESISSGRSWCLSILMSIFVLFFVGGTFWLLEPLKVN